MKWMIAITLTGSTLIVPVSTPGIVQDLGTSETPTHVATMSDYVPSFEEYHDAQVKAHQLAVAKRHEDRMSHAIKLVLNRVGKTPYVLSGSTPNGWDCSGMVMWMYSKLGIELPHSAAAQMYVGRRTNHPSPGDIVIWGGGYHSGIYLGKGKAVSALNYAFDTRITKVGFLGGGVTYINVY